MDKQLVAFYKWSLRNKELRTLVKGCQHFLRGVSATAAAGTVTGWGELSSLKRSLIPTSTFWNIFLRRIALPRWCLHFSLWLDRRAVIKVSKSILGSRSRRCRIRDVAFNEKFLTCARNISRVLNTGIISRIIQRDVISHRCDNHVSVAINICYARIFDVLKLLATHRERTHLCVLCVVACSTMLQMDAQSRHTRTVGR